MRMIPLKDRIFEIIDGVLYVFEKGLEESGLSINYYRKEKSNCNKRLIFLDHPNDRRYNLVAYDTLSDQHKEKIKVRFGNPSDAVAREPIMKLVDRNLDSHNYFLQYTYNTGTKLPYRRCLQYSRAVDWLDAIKKVQEEKNKFIKDLGICVPEFFDHVKALMQTEKQNGASESYDGTHQLPGDFPISYGRLIKKVDEYKTGSYSVVIDKMYGNQLASKVNDEVAKAQLLSLIEDPRQFDDVMIAMLYNQWAAANGYKHISAATVGIWRRDNESEIIMGREGNNAYNEKFIRQVKGFRPSFPLALVEHDDNNLDFLFHNTQDDLVSKYVALVVTDSHCDLVLGKSYIVRHKPVIEQVYHAYIDAMYYIRYLTGGWHMPFEVKADKYAIKSLLPFYQKIGNHVPPSHGNKHRGYIEQFFRTPLWKRAQQISTDPERMNWSGNNMSAKFRGVNEELLRFNQSKRILPLIDDKSELQIENFFHLLRHMPDFKREEMDALSKEQQWVKSWKELSVEKRESMRITDEKFFLTFGITHQPKHKDTIKITNRGVEPQIKNAQYSYDLPEAWMYQKLRGADVQIIYDPFDMSRVLVTNNDDIRFIAHTAQLQPRALEDTYTGSRTYLNAILAEKKDQVKQVSNASKKRKELVDTRYYNAEAMLQGGGLLKGIQHQAEMKMIDSGFNEKHESFLDDNNDFDKFFNNQNKIA
jgi:hypothetical protein